MSLSEEFWWIGACILAMFVLPVGLVFVIALREKRLVWEFAPVREDVAENLAFEEQNPYAVRAVIGEQAPARSDYSLKANFEVENASFLHLGEFVHAKGGIYRVHIDLWCSPERDIIAIVADGTMANMTFQTINLISQLSDGRVLKTISNQCASEIDLTGHWEEALVSNASFIPLYDFHRRRLSVQRMSAKPFSSDDPLADLRAVERTSVDRLINGGYGRYLDEEKTSWRYTLKGAMLFALKAQFTGWRRVFYPDRWLVQTA